MDTNEIKSRFKLKFDTKNNWQSINPVLLNNEPGFFIDNNNLCIVIGNGTSKFSDLEVYHIPHNAIGSADSIGYSSPTDTKTIKDAIDEKLGKNENAASATKATNDKNGNDIAITYIKSLTVEGRVITYTKGDGTTKTITIQDNDTTYNAGTGLSLSGTTFNHKNSVTAGTAQGDASKTLAFGGTFTIPTVTYDAQGHITGKGTTTMTMPTNPNTDTKNTAGSTDTSSKIFLVGATSQAANPQTYSDNQVYAQNGQLNVNSVRVAEKVTMQYNSNTESLDFVFS